MPKVTDKGYGHYNNEPKETYEVYGVRTYERKCREYDNSWTEEINEFYIYAYGEWGWRDTDDYMPFNQNK